MKLHPMLRPILALLAVLLLLGLAYEGIAGGVQQWSEWSTIQHRIQMGSQFISGVSALMILVTTFRWRQMRPYAELGFVVCGVLAASLAAVVWGAGTVLSAVSTGIVTLLITLAIVWMVHAGVDTFAFIHKPEN